MCVCLSALEIPVIITLPNGHAANNAVTIQARGMRKRCLHLSDRPVLWALLLPQCLMWTAWMIHCTPRVGRVPCGISSFMEVIPNYPLVTMSRWRPRFWYKILTERCKPSILYLENIYSYIRHVCGPEYWCPVSIFDDSPDQPTSQYQFLNRSLKSVNGKEDAYIPKQVFVEKMLINVSIPTLLLAEIPR